MSAVSFPLRVIPSIKALHPSVVDAKGITVMRIPMSRISGDALPKDKADEFAAFAARACNSHDRLVDALKYLLETAEAFHVNGVYFDNFVENRNARDTARDALKLAAGVQP